MDKVITISVPIELAHKSNEEIRRELVNAIYDHTGESLLPYNHRAITVQFRLPIGLYFNLKNIAQQQHLTIKGTACNLLWSNYEEV